MKIIPLGWVNSFIRAQNREWCAPVIFGMSRITHLLTVWWNFLFITAYKHLNLPNVWSSQTYIPEHPDWLISSPTHSSRQYHLLIHFIKQILIMRRWLNWVRMWPTNLYRVLKWRQTKPISLWDTDLQILLSVVSWDIGTLFMFCTCPVIYRRPFSITHYWLLIIILIPSLLVLLDVLHALR